MILEAFAVALIMAIGRGVARSVREDDKLTSDCIDEAIRHGGTAKDGRKLHREVRRLQAEDEERRISEAIRSVGQLPKRLWRGARLLAFALLLPSVVFSPGRSGICGVTVWHG